VLIVLHADMRTETTGPEWSGSTYPQFQNNPIPILYIWWKDLIRTVRMAAADCSEANAALYFTIQGYIVKDGNLRRVKIKVKLSPQQAVRTIGL
jgi:hypothetical protein